MAEEIPFHLKGNFAPVEDEISVDSLEIEGREPVRFKGP